MINFKNYITQKVLSESASQKHHIMTKRPTPFSVTLKVYLNQNRQGFYLNQTELQEVEIDDHVR